MTHDEWMKGQSWYQRWLARVSQAWETGVMDHTREPDALECTLARYGYLVSLNHPATRTAYEAEKARLGVKGGLSDAQRYAWEDRYIKEASKAAVGMKMLGLTKKRRRSLEKNDDDL